MYPIFDLHSDLLSYLTEKPSRTPLDPESRSSLPQLEAGHVAHQLLAVFTETKLGSTLRAKAQLDAFAKLSHPKIQFQIAFESGSGFAEEGEPLSLSLERLERILKAIGKVAYISLTWNGENRLGGGTGSSTGLKEDGKTLLEWMSDRKIAVDFSHTSDPLAEGILDYIDRKGLKLPVLASHSNFRKIMPMDRNLPDWLAKELIARKGIIGMNLFAPFLQTEDAIIRHVEYGLQLKGEHALAFGADFFCDTDFTDLVMKYPNTPPYFPATANASCYPNLLNRLQKALELDDLMLQRISNGNAKRWAGAV